ncbi:class I SAM-dependent methyltransferase, partial [candidate division KSB1 bacterium]|nr:class I SAM-dependent methyltransferase [candidate division KSB1 bacterium]
MNKYISHIKDLVENGGPVPEDFSKLNHLFNSVATIIRESPQSKSLTEQIRAALGEAISIDTIQGYGLQKPYGYSGDFLMIDKIYQHHTSANAKLKNWDLFFHAQKAPIAVRNRKQYFIDLLTHLRTREKDKPLHILNVACGPCRDVYEYLQATGDRNMHFHCVDYDIHALEYAQKICADFLDQITFCEKNALRFRSEIKFDLVWSAGLLDYFPDKPFKFVLKRLFTLLHPNGEMV